MKGILLINLGSPDSTSTKDVRKYLDEFLMDERVIDMPYWKRFLLVKGVILNTRPKKSAAAYKKIWQKEGSPLEVISKRFTIKLQKNIDIPVALGMRYGSMSMENSIDELHQKGVTEILMIPMYPHFAMSSYETVEVKAKEILANKYPLIKLELFPVFYNEPNYIKAMVSNIENHLKDVDFEHILFSYHGLPERHILLADTTKSHCKLDGSCCNTSSIAHKTCYRHQCFETTKEIIKLLNLNGKTHSNSFQSRLLKDPWLKPYTDLELERFPNKGIKKLVVITPAFVTDCLETLEEIAMEGKNQFIEAGGENYKHIPCMNDNDDWVDVVTNWVKEWS
ncbi:MAG: ferrochelatase [Flavobacteriaceae bacterium]